MLHLLDTNVLSELLKNHPRLRAHVNALDSGDTLAIPNVAWFEIINGRMASLLTADTRDQLMTAQSRLEKDIESMDEFEVYAVSMSVAEFFLTLKTDKKCKKMRRGDLLIACIALAHQAVLVTRNVKDFANVPGLQIQNWFN